MDRLERFTYYFLQCALYFAAILPLPRAPKLSAVYRLGWIVFLLYFSGKLMYTRYTSADTSIVRLVSVCLSVWCAIIYIACLLESTWKQRKYVQLQQLQQHIDQLCAKYLQLQLTKRQRYAHLKRPILLLFLILLTCETLKTYNNQRWHISSVFWLAMPVIQGLRMQYFLIIVVIIELNQRLLMLRCALQRLVAYNRPKLRYCGSDIWRPYTPWEYEQLNALRLIYGRLYQLLCMVNDCFGWSMLLIIQTAFCAFVCYIYWCLTVQLVNQGGEVIVSHCATLLTLGSLHYTLFWHAYVVGENGRQIAALTCQLHKSLGNKHYNDLLREFTLQITHQEFVIHTKGVIIINLHTLGNMIFAVTTYLALLLQFTYAGTVRSIILKTTTSQPTT